MILNVGVAIILFNWLWIGATLLATNTLLHYQALFSNNRVTSNVHTTAVMNTVSHFNNTSSPPSVIQVTESGIIETAPANNTAAP
jgi:hypothetical protein